MISEATQEAAWQSVHAIKRVRIRMRNPSAFVSSGMLKMLLCAAVCWALGMTEYALRLPGWQQERTHIDRTCFVRILHCFCLARRRTRWGCGTGWIARKHVQELRQCPFICSFRLLGTTENALGLRDWLKERGHTLVVTSDKDGDDCELEKQLPDTDILITTVRDLQWTICQVDAPGVQVSRVSCVFIHRTQRARFSIG